MKNSCTRLRWGEREKKEKKNERRIGC